LSESNELLQARVIMYGAPGIHHDAELHTRFFRDLHHMIDSERGCEMNVQIHQWELVNRLSEASGNRRRGYQPACDPGGLQKSSPFHFHSPQLSIAFVASGDELLHCSSRSLVSPGDNRQL